MQPTTRIQFSILPFYYFYNYRMIFGLVDKYFIHGLLPCFIIFYFILQKRILVILGERIPGLSSPLI